MAKLHHFDHGGTSLAYVRGER